MRRRYGGIFCEPMTAMRVLMLSVMLVLALPAATDVRPLHPPIPEPGRGFYDEPLHVVLESTVVNATLRYTLDGAEPTETHGLTYRLPLEIATTTTLRAATFAPGQQRSEVVTHTYIFLDDVIQQPAQVPGYNPPDPFPTSSVVSKDVLHDNEMDPDITQHPVYGPLMRKSLTSIPTMSIVADPARVFGTNGFYETNSRVGGPNPSPAGLELSTKIEVPVSIEVLYPDEPARNEQVNAGIMGHAKRKNKRAFRVAFRGIYGDSKWNTDLLRDNPVVGDSATTSLDRIVLRSGNNRCWCMHYSPPTYTEDEHFRASQIAMSGYGSHGVYVHLYINGLYWGLYNPAERPNEDFQESYFGGNDGDYFSINHRGIKSGEAEDWNFLVDGLASMDLDDLDNWALIQEYLDVDGYSDYMLLGFYTGQGDWPINNWWGGGRFDPLEPHRLFAWDGEYSWTNYLPTATCGEGAMIRTFWQGSYLNNPLQDLWFGLRQSEEYLVAFADRAYKQLFNDGGLSTENSLARYDTLNAWIEDAVIAESARWGDTGDEQYGSPLRTRDEDWRAEIDEMRFLIKKNAVQLIAILRQNGWYPDYHPPLFEQRGGQAWPGFEVVLTDPNPTSTVRTAWYTTDGSDPRLLGGAINPAARPYAGPIVLDGTTTIKVRFAWGPLTDPNWSAIDNVTFSADLMLPPLPTVRVVELMYNPAEGGSFDDQEYEFVEVQNIGTETISLAGVRFADGIDFNFTGSAVPSLAPGERALAVENTAAFAERYGTGLPVAGQFSGGFKNSSERVELVDGFGRSIHAFTYDDGWYDSTDGDGPSLVINDPTGPLEAWNSPDGWHPSSEFGGSPGVDENPLPSLDVRKAGAVEGDAGSRTMVFSVDISHSPTVGVTVDYATQGDSATTGTDFVSTAGTLTFTPGGPLREQIAVEILGDMDAEPNESFRLQLSDPVNASLADVSARGTIYNDDPVPALPQLRVTELNFNPAQWNAPYEGEEYEFVELQNVGEFLIDLDGVHFDDGIDFDFTGSAVTTLAPGEFVLIVSNSLAFVQRYGGDLPVAGQYAGKLSNGGENLRILDLYDRVIQEFKFDDHWYRSADGDGHTLTINDSNQEAHLWPNDDGWHASYHPGGTPGEQEWAGVSSPRPGEVYREVDILIRTATSPEWRVTDPFSPSAGAQAHLPNPIIEIDIPIGALQAATHAEFVIDKWGGHAGTSFPQLRFNDSEWLSIPDLDTVPESPIENTDPQCYMQQTNPVVSVPLDHLLEGGNILEGTSGGQTCFSFNWGQWGWYGGVIRIYYDPALVDEPSGAITSHSDGGIVTDNDTITVTGSGGGGIDRVDVLAFVEAYDVDGDGHFRNFQQAYHRQPYDQSVAITNHVGTDTSPPFQLNWNTQYIPDQPHGSVRLLARVRAANGLWTVTPIVEDLTLQRPYSVRMIKPSKVPPRFWVNFGQKMSSEFFVPEALTLSGLTNAYLMLNTWNGNDGLAEPGQDSHVKFNTLTLPTSYGNNHTWSSDVRSVSWPYVRHGVNTVEFYSESTHHGMEILWPGPALLLRYNSVLPAVCGNGFVDPDETCDDGNTTAGDGCGELCHIERCGNGVLQSDEACDDGNPVNGDGCDTACRLEVCGNGILQIDETCDDANATNDDTCSNDYVDDPVTKKPLLPADVLYRSKDGLSDAVGHNWVDSLLTHANNTISDKDLNKARQRWSHNTPKTKEAYWYRQIFEELYPNRSHVLQEMWLPRWSGDLKDPSARKLEHYK